jgi:hypothetical protein
MHVSSEAIQRLREPVSFPIGVNDVGASSLVILLAKSEGSTIYVRHEPENRV